MKSSHVLLQLRRRHKLWLTLTLGAFVRGLTWNAKIHIIDWYLKSLCDVYCYLCYFLLWKPFFYVVCIFLIMKVLLLPFFSFCFDGSTTFGFFSFLSMVKMSVLKTSQYWAFTAIYSETGPDSRQLSKWMNEKQTRVDQCLLSSKYVYVKVKSPNQTEPVWNVWRFWTHRCVFERGRWERRTQRRTCRRGRTGTVSLPCVVSCDRSACWTERTPGRRCHTRTASPRCEVWHTRRTWYRKYTGVLDWKVQKPR